MKSIAILIGSAVLATSALAANNLPSTSGDGDPAEKDNAYYHSTWKRMDANGDGRVSRQEYLAYYGNRYDRYDSRRRGYFENDSEMRRLLLERELSKSDGTPLGDPSNPTTPKR